MGFAAAAWVPPKPPIVMVAADSRISFDQAQSPIDTGIKVYDLGGRAAMVAAGFALPALTAAEIVRPIVANHNRQTPDRRMGFYDTTRLLSFFLKRTAERQNGLCEVAISGFLSSGAPAVAYVIVSPDRNRVIFHSIKSNVTMAISVGGHPEASRLLMQGFAAAKRQGKPVIATGLCLLWYIAQHQAFSSVGGGIAVGTCMSSDDSFSWPIVEFSGQRFLRGFDVTASYRPSWPLPEVAPYDEEWCHELDQRIAKGQGLTIATSIAVSGYEIDSLSTPDDLFKTRDDPEAFENGVAV